jgi:multidrug efflux pump subunit AcrB
MFIVRVRLFENDVFAQIGLVMLIGLAAKNAIFLIPVMFARLRDFPSGTERVNPKRLASKN